jgi:anion-transporting  ArsA/GET3 family ATPase
MSAGAHPDLLASRLLVCLGPGGVGKTTLSAALALSAAMAGRQVDVMTVDPAPRLLDALGLDVGDAADPREVPLSGIRGQPAPRTGRLRALRLDPKRTFDAIIARHASSAAAADAILQNRIYRNLSQALAGVGDYMAMERLLELSDEPATDLVVLDTPPAREAIDFLDAPRRLVDLLNSRAITLLGGGMRRGLGVVDLAARAVLAAFDRLTGLHLLGDVQAFVRSFDGMYAGFAERAERARALLLAPGTAVAVITTAEPERTAQAREFIAELDAAGITTRAVIVNRTLPAMPTAAEVERARIRPALKRKLAQAAREFAALGRREADAIASLRAGLPAGVMMMKVPDLGREPATLTDLAAVGDTLAPL